MATAPTPLITAGFDGGNGELIDSTCVEGVFDARLNMGKEPFTQGTDKREHWQWFYFKASNLQAAAISTCKFRLVNAGSSSYPAAWPGTWAVASYSDRSVWFRTPTTYDPSTGELCVTVAVEPGQPHVYVAYFAPFSYEQHLALIADCAAKKDTDGSPLCSVTTLTATLQNREVEMITAGSGPLKLWFTCRQHPGESMAEWWAKGFLARLLSSDDDLARKLRSLATFRVVPNMNPDGAVMGHLRTNACGANLNREWASTGEYVAPSMERSPEVFAVLALATEIGVDLWVDVHVRPQIDHSSACACWCCELLWLNGRFVGAHMWVQGDEELPHVFFAGAQGIPGWNDRHAELYRLFATAQLKACPAFQLLHGYGNEQIGEANMAICSDHIAAQFDCLAVTLEMPYKDSLELPEPSGGWSAGRCERLGASMLNAVEEVCPFLRRADFPFGNGGIGDGLDTPQWVR
jgi:murein tripeptide amidase MpaA